MIALSSPKQFFRDFVKGIKPEQENLLLHQGMSMISWNIKDPETSDVSGSLIFQSTHLAPISSSVIFFPSTMVNPPIPGRTKDFKISVPRPVALIKQTRQLSRAA